MVLRQLAVWASLGVVAAIGFASPVFAQAQPQITITSPVNGATVAAPDVTVTISVTGTTLVPAAQATRKEDLHVHYLLDTDPAPWLSGTTPVPMGNPNIVHSGALSNTFNGVSAGPHTVNVLLGFADHTAFQPVVDPSVSFTVAGQATAPAQLPRTGDLGNPALLLILVGIAGIALGTAVRLGFSHRR